jgi:hypothetical protein
MNRNLSGVYALLLSLEGFATAAFLWLRKNNATDPELYSGKTLVLFYVVFSGAIIIGLISLIIFILLRIDPKRFDTLKEQIINGRLYAPSIFILCIVLLECIQDLLYLLVGFHKPDLIYLYYSKYLSILVPIFVWGVLFSVKSLVFLILKSPSNKLWSWIKTNKTSPVFIIFLILFGVWLLLGFTDFGYIPGTYRDVNRTILGRFLPLTNPLMGIQVVVVVLFLLFLFLVYQKHMEGQRSIIKNPWIIPIFIWLGAVILWWTVPIESNYLVDFPKIPAGETYPNSDAFYYAKEAQRFSVGAGFEDRTTHVFYSLFISLMHWITDGSYQSIITLQKLIVALVPVLLYLFSRRLHSGFSGILIAILFIIRERNGLILGEELAGPVTNVLLSENLAQLGMIAFLYLFFMWVEKPENRTVMPALAGAVMGISLLIRIDFLAALLAVTVVSLYVLWRKKVVWLKGIILLFLTIGVIITPWIYRNWQKTGDLFLDKHNVLYQRLASYVEKIRSDEIENQGANDIYIDSESQQLSRINSMANHIGNNLHQSFLYLPNSYHPLAGIGNYVFEGFIRRGNNSPLISGGITEETLNIYTKASSYYWFEWDGKTSYTSILPVAGVLLVISLGIVWTRSTGSRVDLLFASALLAHSIIWAVTRFSGNRFIKTVDWMVLIWFGIGLTIIIGWIGKELNGTGRELVLPIYQIDGVKTGVAHRVQPSFRFQLLIAIVLIIVGWSPAIVESAIPNQYSDNRMEEMITELQKRNELIYDQWISCQALNEEAVDVYYGRALYPRFYQEGEILGNDRRGIFQDPSQPRINFYLVGMENMGVTFKGSSQDDIFLHQTDIVVSGILKPYGIDHFIEAYCAFGIDPDQNVIYVERTY